MKWIARTVSGQNNPLSQWSDEHPRAQPATRSQTGPCWAVTRMVAQNACISCHMPHNSLAGARLLRGPVPSVNNMDSATQNCITCHAGGTNISRRPFPTCTRSLRRLRIPTRWELIRTIRTKRRLLNNNRHATCVDCHSPHASQAVDLICVALASRDASFAEWRYWHQCH